jgi:DNA-binding FadR family transcriptional regulator
MKGLPDAEMTRAKPKSPTVRAPRDPQGVPSQTPRVAPAPTPLRSALGGQLRVPKTGEAAANLIRRRIVTGELKAGDYLPNEGQLMESLSISRPTLREAFRILEAERLITLVRGSRTGALVHAPRIEAVARAVGFVFQTERTTIADVYQARLAIEPYAARLLAERRDLPAAIRLRGEIERLTELVDQDSFVEFVVAVAEFHVVLMQASGNTTLYLITRLLLEMVERYQAKFIATRERMLELRRTIARTGIRSFQKLVSLIEAGDGPGAEAHWQEHLKNANKAWLDEQGKDAMVEILD